jgi:hypothetical protein
MMEELDALRKNKTWEVTHLREGKKAGIASGFIQLRKIQKARSNPLQGKTSGEGI